MNKEELKLITRICHLYYKKDRLQSQIAKELNITRQMVSRLLQKAHTEGIVKINIQSPASSVIELETFLKERLKLRDVIVIQDDWASEEQRLEKLAITAGEYLRNIIVPKQKIGLVPTKVYELMAEWIYGHASSFDVSNINLYPLCGQVPSTQTYDNISFQISLMAKALGAQQQVLSMPLIIEDNKIYQYVLKDPLYKSIIDGYSKLDIAFVDITSKQPQFNSAFSKVSTSSKQYLNTLGISSYNNLDIAGFMCFNPYDSNGEFINNDTNYLKVNDKQLSKIKNVVAVAHEVDGIEAAIGALKSGVVNTFITEENIATEMIKMIL